jgi:hypothetical protein
MVCALYYPDKPPRCVSEVLSSQQREARKLVNMKGAMFHLGIPLYTYKDLLDTLRNKTNSASSKTALALDRKSKTNFVDTDEEVKAKKSEYKKKAPQRATAAAKRRAQEKGDEDYILKCVQQSTEVDSKASHKEASRIAKGDVGHVVGKRRRKASARAIQSAKSF